MSDLSIEEYARKASIALAGCAGLVGSEAFMRVGDEYYADPDFCRQLANERLETIRRLLSKRDVA